MLAMIVLLLNRGRISAKELADRFEVSTKTIYRDMDTLSQSGIPIFAHQGTAGGFEIMEQYTISRQYLSLEEISSIIAAVKGIRTALDDTAYAKLHEKVKSLLHKSDKQQAGSSEESLVFDLNPWGQGPAARLKVNLFKQAIEETRSVQLSYINMNGTETERVIEPYALILKGNVWYVQAYCMLREQFRVFRLSRVQKHALLEECFERRDSPSLESYAWDTEWSKNAETEVTLLFRPQVRYRVADAFRPDQVSVLENGSVRVEGKQIVDEFFYGMLLSFGNQVKVEQPAHIAEQVVQRAKNIIACYEN
ncbi:YafY family protein [Paenibacillus sp. LHD-38]|uniref:helix-turn-helix transcriptional regulator n=1 Tax=Paenibacillus sp. LHD-38 TaxID=3072143 RepID=UPI00280D7FF0|nr:YafY family protein [Paenibacillus sp. LHD-38]MDQ8736942.1 YafY family protein [Paenibacillus sp. LHD-38]